MPSSSITILFLPLSKLSKFTSVILLTHQITIRLVLLFHAQ